MKQQSKLSAIVLILIGVIAGGLFFSQFNQSTQPLVYSAPTPAPSPDSSNILDQPVFTLRDFNRAFVQIAKKVNPTVVTVFTEKVYKVRGFGGSPFFNSPFEDFFQDFFGQRRPRDRRQQPREQEYRQQGLGSGVIVSTDGYILTNNHVIDDADTIYVRLMDNRTVSAKVIGADPKTDIAVIKIEEKDLPAIKLGDSDKLEVGEWVMAIGSPMSPNLAHTVTSGIVSAKSRSNVGLADYEDFIQTDAAINPGNSGGALINLEGELVGINTAIVTRSGGFQGIGFAVPINLAKYVMNSLIKYGKVERGFLGVYIQDIDENMARAMGLPGTDGALVSQVGEDGPAKEAGIKDGDVILELNGEKIKNSSHLRNQVAATAPGTKVKLKIWRDGKEKTITVKLGILDGGKAERRSTEEVQSLFGFTIATLNSDLAEKYGLERDLEGVVVTSMEPSSPAARAGIREGDVITDVNRKEIKNAKQFSEVAKKLKKGDSVFLRVMRGNRSFFVAFTL